MSDQQLLFAYDGSEYAKAAIAAAGAELRTPRPATVLTVSQPIESVAFGAPLAGIPSNVVEAIADEAGKIADEGAALAREAGFETDRRVVSGTPTWRRILDVADEVDAGVIVMGSHGRSGVTALVMGSVATAVAHHSTRPVFVVPRPSH